MSARPPRWRSCGGALTAMCLAAACTSAPPTGDSASPQPDLTVLPAGSMSPPTIQSIEPTVAESVATTSATTSPATTVPVITVPTTTVAVTAAPVLPAPVEGLPLDWVAVAAWLGPVQLPSDCPLPLNQPGLLPNSDRSYRGGVHEGVDFVCMEFGHEARAALPGRVLMLIDTYQDPDPADRQALLDEAKALGYTPPYTLQFLFGRFVVIDHGIIDGLGHVVSIYAHLAAVDSGLRPGAQVAAGALIGQIGNSGTETAAMGGTRPQSIHLHWELHIDDHYYSEGLNEADTSAALAVLFAPR